MNLIINQRCNKKCSFCFADMDTKQTDMSLEFFESLVKQIPDIYIRIMGGEPTLHPLFLQFLDIVFSYNKIPLVFSNFLFSEKVLEGLKSRLSENKRIIFLANLSDLKEPFLSVAAHNYSEIYRILSMRNRSAQLSVSLTIDINHPETSGLSYLKTLIEHEVDVGYLRFCMMAPSPSCYKVSDFKGKTEVGDALIELCKYCNNNGIEITIDEAIYPCTFKKLDDYYYVKKFWTSSRDLECYVKPPTDVFSNNTASFCYPLKGKINLPIINVDTIESELSKKLEDIKTISNTCKSCMYYKSHCKGACPAWS